LAKWDYSEHRSGNDRKEHDSGIGGGRGQMGGKGAIFDFLGDFFKSPAEVTHERVNGARDQ